MSPVFRLAHGVARFASDDDEAHLETLSDIGASALDSLKIGLLFIVKLLRKAE